MITCIFGLTACGSEEELTPYEQKKVTMAEESAVQKVLPTLIKFMDDDNATAMDEYTPEEVEHLVADTFDFNTEGYAFLGAIESFHSAKASLGKVTEEGLGDVDSKIDGDTIIVHVQVQGEKKNAEAEVIFSNDMFVTLESAALNPISSMGELMGKAVLNTLIGMGTVFVVLILISFIISAFGYIPKIQAALSGKKEAQKDSVDMAVTQIAVQEEEIDQSDDLELVAVIAAAIAASEGAASTDGFVVRSIRRARR